MPCWSEGYSWRPPRKETEAYPRSRAAAGAYWLTLRVHARGRRRHRSLGKQTLVAKCEELLEFLADHDEHRKLRQLTEDITQLRDRLQLEQDTGNGGCESPR